MKITVDIDGGFMSEGMRASGCKTKTAAIKAGLRLLVQMSGQKKLRSLKGKIAW